MKTPLVYIVMPCYNSEKFLLEQLMSIYYQNYTNWYLIFVNDGSTDSSENIIKDWIFHYNLHDKVKVINKENGGVNSAVQRGLEEVKKICDIHNTDSLISYCDSDDIWTRVKLFEQVSFMTKNPKIDLSFHDLTLINENGVPYQNSYMKYTYLDFSFLYLASVGSFLVSTGMMYKAYLIEELLPMPTGPQMYQDKWTAFVLSLQMYNMEYIDKPLAYYRQGHTNSLIAKAKSMEQKKRYINIQKYYQFLQEKFPTKDISNVTNYYFDRYVNWYDYGLVSVKSRVLTLIKYPKISYLLLKAFLRKLFKSGKLPK